jgi:hypothetical protein
MASTAPSAAARTIDIETGQGLARVHVIPAADARAALVLHHGAGGGVGAPDLQAAAAAASERHVTVGLFEQPYRVAGKKAPVPAPRLDAAWREVLEQIRVPELGGLPLVLGGRSMGGRVACRTAGALGAVGVLCLAFPLVPPRRATAKSPPASRLPELEAVSVPVLIVQGRGDPFGMPQPARRRAVIQVEGNHSLRSDLAKVRTAVSVWLDALV